MAIQCRASEGPKKENWTERVVMCPFSHYLSRLIIIARPVANVSNAIENSNTAGSCRKPWETHSGRSKGY